ncbi:MAG TPA: hypothetical protein VG963_30190, partial [Polyangiaceae bacterium]|nr:hypothetical protein [Polyangiaceae bacterium]
MDYDSLLSEGRRALEQYASDPWTDFNPHDPGITLLEALCYVLTDLVYRTGHTIPELLASSRDDAYANLYAPREILSSNAVTTADLRKVLLNLEGVRNAWIEAAAWRDGMPLKGLYRVCVDAEDSGLASSPTPLELVQRVTECLHRQRPLAEDFTEVRVLPPQAICVTATVEIGPLDDPEWVREEILRKLDQHIAPSVRFASAAAWWHEGRAVDEIFDGPLLEHGAEDLRFVDAEALRQMERPSFLYPSKVLEVIASVKGVRVVKTLRLGPNSAPGSPPAHGQPSQPLNPRNVPAPFAPLSLETDKCPRLDRVNSQIWVERAGGALSSLSLTLLRPANPSPQRTAALDPFAPPPFRDRHVAKYTPVYRHLPGIYGVGEGALPEGTSPQRRAQARQLATYLQFFDQPMANYLAQLAHLGELFAFEASPDTYFEQEVLAPGVIVSAQEPPLPPATPDPSQRRQHFLDHLLARFAEQFTDYLPKGEQPLEGRAAFLRHYLRVSAARGTGLDVYAPMDRGNRSGLEDRIVAKLGLAE